MLLPLLLACTPEPSATPPPAPAPAPVEEEPPPTAKIDAEPILARPVVLGGIDAKAVDAGIAARRAAIDRCWSDAGGRAGKVLVKFSIHADGRVASAATKSTSLRSKAAEDCINARVAEARFPPLQMGSVAIVLYPFVFP